MFVLRQARQSDLKQILSLSRMLGGINLSTIKEELVKTLQISEQAFEGELRNKFEAQYVFCLEDTSTQNIVGTSMIIAQHGTKESPHYFFQVLKKEKFSKTIHSGIVHQILRLGLDMDGPTEVGGLILSPAFRGTGKGAGKLLSLGSFLYMAMHRRRFKERVISEFLPPLTSEGKSVLWEALGRKFTNLPYLDADRISRKSKEFITSLFPNQDIFLCLLDAKVVSTVGMVGPDTIPALKMLENIGFRYLDMVDPFDGGPHYGARMKDLTLMKNKRKYRLKGGKVKKFPSLGLVAKLGADEFKVVLSNFKATKKLIQLPQDVYEVLSLEYDDTIVVSELPKSKKK